MKYETLKRSTEFKRVRGGVRCSGPLFVIEGRVRPVVGDGAGTPVRLDRAGERGGPRFGFTITRKVGNAVVRNRIRRRLKEALRALEPGLARDGYDYVLIARAPVCDHPFDGLKDVLRAAFEALASQRGAASGLSAPPNGGKAGRRRRSTPGPAARGVAGEGGNRDPGETRQRAPSRLEPLANPAVASMPRQRGVGVPAADEHAGPGMRGDETEAERVERLEAFPDRSTI